MDSAVWPGFNAAVAAAVDKEKADPLDVPEPEEGEGTRSRYGMIVGILLGAGVLGGSGYLLYQNMDALLAPDSKARMATLPRMPRAATAVRKFRHGRSEP